VAVDASLGRYEILECGARVAWVGATRARDRKSDRIVALKVIRRDMAGDET